MASVQSQGLLTGELGLDQQARPLSCGCPTQGHVTSWSQQCEHQPMVDLARAGGFIHSPGWVPCPDLAFLCCCCSGNTSQGLLRPNTTTWHITLGAKAWLHGVAYVPTALLVPSVPSFAPLSAANASAAAARCIFWGLLGRSPCAARRV